MSFGIDAFSLSILNRTKRHDDFLVPMNSSDCRIDLEEFHERCDYLNQKGHESCFEKIHFIDYTTFLFCFGTKNTFHYICALLIIVLCCFYLFLVLGVTADQFFCPALTVIAKVLRMSESLAGVTVLAFGNGAPDLFMALSDPHGDTVLMYNELLGGASFIISVIGGSIILIRQFRIEGFKLALDCLFFIVAINYIGYAIHDKMFTFKETTIIVAIYVAYISIAVIEDCVVGGKVVEIERYEPSETDEPKSMIMQAIVALNPLDEVDDHTSGASYFLLIIEIPIIVILRLIIPKVDYTIERDGWCKLLNTLHCLLVPQLILFAFELYKKHFWNFPLSLIVLVISVPFAICLCCFSSKDHAPKYHIIFVILTVAGASSVIYSVANEIMGMLFVIGQATGLSHSILGITILSWGNSVGDLVSNLVLAKKGYARFGFAGCFGGAMFNFVTGMGITFILKLSASRNKVAFGREGAMGPNCTVYLFLLLVFTLVAFIMANLWARRVIGVYMLTIYVIFLVFCCLNEAEVIHSLGTDHSDQLHIRFGELVQGEELPDL